MRTQVSALYWEREGGQFRIYARQPDRTPDDLDFAASVIGGDVPLTGWRELARQFRERIEK